MNKVFFRTFLVSALLATVPLTGCTALAIGGVAAGGLAITDRRTVGAQTDDQTMEMAIKSQSMSYFKQQGSANSTVSATSYNRNILLTGVWQMKKKNKQSTAWHEPKRPCVKCITILMLARLILCR